jgi:hypothetical protein
MKAVHLGARKVDRWATSSAELLAGYWALMMAASKAGDLVEKTAVRWVQRSAEQTVVTKAEQRAASLAYY